jgi:hypothetical protein
MTLRMIHFFEDEDDGLGWSEVWYLGVSDFTAAQDIARSWAATRAQILAPDVQITYSRIVGNLPATAAPRARQQRLATLQRINQLGTAQGAGGRFGDTPWQAVKLRWQSADQSVFRTQLVRGLPDAWFDKGDDKVGSAAVRAWTQAALAAIGANTMQIRHVVGLPVKPDTRPFAYVAPQTLTYEGYTRRATGRPFGLPRGRRSNRT